MANPSILAAFERMWQHTIAKIGTKADIGHGHLIEDVDGLQTVLDSIPEVLGSDGKLLNNVLPEGYPYKTSGFVEFYPETNININGDIGRNPCSKLLFENGKDYIVTIDGVEYLCTGWLPDGAPDDMVVLGNGEFQGVSGGDDVPFVMWTQYGSSYEPYTQGELYMIYPSNNGNHTISISAASEKIQKIYYGFMPDGVPYYGEDELYVAVEPTNIEFTEEEWTSNLDFYIEANKEYIVICDNVEYEFYTKIFMGYLNYIGNGSLVYPEIENTGEPFCIFSTGNTTRFIVNELGTHNFSIKTTRKMLNKLPYDLLPDEVNQLIGYDIETLNQAIANKADKEHSHAVIIETNKNLEQKFWRGTQAEYDAIVNKDDSTMYIVTDGEGGEGGGGRVGSLSDLGVTATAAELNYVEGVTSNIQEQLNGKSDDNHTHGVSDITSGILGVEVGGTGFNSIVDTTYTTARYRASSLHSVETTPTINGVICWMYE